MKSLNLQLVLLAITLLSTWLPLVRGVFDGDAYQWRNIWFGHSFSGYGVQSDYGLLVWRAVLYAAYQVSQRRWFYVLATLWFGLWAMANIYEMLTRPDDFVLRGDTLSLVVPLHVPFSVFMLGTGWVLLRAIHTDNQQSRTTSGLDRRWLWGYWPWCPFSLGCSATDRKTCSICWASY